MKVFIYNWEILDDNIFGYGLGPVIIKIIDYNPYCYTRSMTTDDITSIAQTTGVYPISYERKYMTSTLDITSKDIYTKLVFKTYKEMKNYCVGVTKKYMHDIDPITGFLSHMQYPFVGWFEIKQKELSKVSIHNLKPIDRTK